MAGRRSKILETFELLRMIGLFAVIALGIFLAVLVDVPIGFVFVVMLVLLSSVWRPIGMTKNQDKGEYRFNTLPMKVASFAMAYKNRWRESLLSPVISVGMGPPRADEDHGLEAGWRPPTRLSSYWALFAALILGLVDFFTAAFRFPFWKLGLNWDFVIPSFVMYPLGVLGFYVGIQSILDVKRQRADGTGIIGTSPAPAVILSSVRQHANVSQAVKRGLIISSGPTLIWAIIWIAAKIPLILGLSVAVGLQLLGFLIVYSVMITKNWREQWEERNGQRSKWEGVFGTTKAAPPIFVSEAQYPTFEEWSMIHEGKDEMPPYVPSVNIATFMFPPGTNYDNYSGLERTIKGVSGAAQIVIAPIGEGAGEGAEQLGTVGSSGFRVWYSEQNIPSESLLDPTTDAWTREFLTRLVLDGMSGIRGLGDPILKSTDAMTRVNSTANMVKVEFNITSNDSIDNYLRNLPTIQDNVLGVRWLGFHGALSERADKKVITMMFGDSPKTEGIRFSQPPRLVGKSIDIATWNYAFFSAGLNGIGGLPKYRQRIKSTDVVDQLLFELPIGTQFDRVQKAAQTIGEYSRNDFLEVSQGEAVSKSRRRPDESSDARLFTIVAAEKDPLKRAFPWKEYESRLLKDRIPGEAQLSWSPGVLANDELAIDAWDGDLPMLLISGASGMGKSQLGMSLLMQLAHNNGPDELNFHFLEPKNELQTFENVDTCMELVDSWSPDNNFMKNAADSAVNMVAEMDRRYQLMRNHIKQPKKLANARLIAKNEGPRADGSKHPLDMPFIIYYIEECATLFADAGSKEEKQEQGRLVAAVAELCRKARAAGIHLIFATQYPTNASIPSVMRNQCRRIGLGVQNRVASDVIIGQSGLELISTPGLGMIKPGKDYRKFRGFYIQDGDPDFGGVNDINDVLARIPQKSSVLKTARTTATRSQRFRLPDVPGYMFSSWEKSKAGALSSIAYEEGRKTKDINDAQATEMAKKYHVESEFDLDANGDMVDVVADLFD